MGVYLYPNNTEIELKNAYIGGLRNGDLSKATLVKSTLISGYIVYGIAFSNDGSKFYYQSNTNGNPGVFHQFDLSTPRDVSTRRNEQTFTFYVGGYTYGIYPDNIFFGNDGKFLCHGYNGLDSGQITWYELSTPWDITTKTTEGNISTGIYSSDVWLSEDGTEFWYSTNNYTGYKQLTTAWTPELGSTVGNQKYGFWYISPGGKYLYYEPNRTSVSQYSLGNGYDFSNPTLMATINKPGSGTRYSQGIYFTPDGNKLFVCGGRLDNPYIYEYSLQ